MDQYYKCNHRGICNYLVRVPREVYYVDNTLSATPINNQTEDLETSESYSPQYENLNGVTTYCYIHKYMIVAQSPYLSFYPDTSAFSDSLLRFITCICLSLFFGTMLCITCFVPCYLICKTVMKEYREAKYRNMRVESELVFVNGVAVRKDGENL